MDTKVHCISIEFADCDAGWIHFTVKAGTHEVQIRASEVFDPFPSLIAWLESIAVGVQECSFEMEEEGPEKRFEYKKYAYQRLSRFRLTDNYQKTHLESLVEPKQLVSVFYEGIKIFATSPVYKKSEWEDESLWERFSKVTNPPTSREVIIRHLLSKTREKLIEVFFKMAPYVIISFPDAKDENESWARGIHAMVDPDGPEKRKGILETPQYWPIPEDFDSWQIQDREAFLEEELNVNVSDKRGTRLGDIHSEIIDKYLEDFTQNNVVCDDGGL
jgi:hypothetical protein